MMEWDLSESDQTKLKHMKWHLSDLCNLIPDDSIGIEIGVWKGWSTRTFLNHTKCKFIYAVDAWSTSVYKESESTEDPEWKSYEAYKKRYRKIVPSGKDEDFDREYDRTYFFASQHLIEYSERIQLYRMSSQSFWETWFGTNKSKVDWAYIDGSHSYEPCLHDLECARKAIRKGGLLMGDDYSPNKPGVIRAVDEFCEKYGYKRNVPNSAWRFWIEI